MMRQTIQPEFTKFKFRFELSDTRRQELPTGLAPGYRW